MAVIAIILFLLVVGMQFGTAGFVVLAVVCIFGVIGTVNIEKEKNDKKTSSQTTWRAQNPYEESSVFEYKNYQKDYKIVFDEKAEKMIVFEGATTPVTLRFSDILGSEIRENGQVTGGVGRALIGGAIAGGAGAIVGATTAKQKILSYQIVILCDNLQKPEYIFELFDKALDVKKNDNKFAEASKFANEINSALKVILRRQG